MPAPARRVYDLDGDPLAGDDMHSDLSPILAPGIYQDGDAFYHDEHGPLMRFPGMVADSHDIEGARRARVEFACACPDLIVGWH